MMENTPFSWELLARYLSAECTDVEMAEIEAWRNASETNDTILREYEDIWFLAGKDSSDFTPNGEEDWGTVKSETLSRNVVKLSSPRGFLFYASRVAAVLLIGLTILFVIYQKSGNDNLKAQQASSRNTRIKLEDGTIVWLNKGSELKYPETFDGQIREVFVKGEGFFEVKRNPAKPFIIHTGNTLTRVLGTSFNINERDEEVKVTVSTGKVAFSVEGMEDKKVELTRGEQGTWTSSTDIVTEMKADPNTLAWHTGALVFEKTSMESLAKTLSSYYSIEIEFADKKIGDCRFTGTFHKADLEEILKTVSLTLGISYEINKDKVLIKGTGC
jgi:transmembrane sensor